jgi:anion-transporting  ArsA/GET3 family ATPase
VVTATPPLPGGGGGGLTDLVAARSVIVCCGPGGVGKTTVAGVLALEGARQGRRAVVLTVDPAKRLADALGLQHLPNWPHRVNGPWEGELWALMLDTKATFDGLVTKYSKRQAQAEAILANRFYKNMADGLSGIQEYMAIEKLFELNDEKRFDLIVVDTPPTRNALDFLDAPRRLTNFIDNRFYKFLMAPTRTGFKAVNIATGAVLRTISKVVGSEVVSDAVTFFQVFEGMEEGFRDRAHRMRGLLADSGTAFVLVASPRRDAVREVGFFADKLRQGGILVKGLVVNRTHPRFGTGLAESDRERARTLAGSPLGVLYENLADFSQMAEAEEDHIGSLVQKVRAPSAAVVPELSSDVHDLDGMAEVARYLFAPDAVGEVAAAAPSPA